MRRVSRAPRALRKACAFVCALAMELGLVAGCVPEPSLVAEVPPHASCDVRITPSNAATTLEQLDDPSRRVFCVAPGDYRGFGRITITSSGTASSRRFLRLDAATIENPYLATRRAVFEEILLRGSWWVVQGITVQPRSTSTSIFFWIQGGDDNLVDSVYVSGSQHPNTGSQGGVYIGALGADPARRNTFQRSVVAQGNRSRLRVDYTGIRIDIGLQPGADNDDNRVLDNEVFDWGDGVSLSGDAPQCAFAGRPHGTIIDGNDIYVTADKRVDCGTGARNANGECSCAENAIDIKPDPGPIPSDWTRVTNNRVWGYRPTSGTCGGSGSNGQAITAGNHCPGHVIVAGNAILDSTSGIVIAGPSWIVAGNLFYEIRRRSSTAGGVAILPLSDARDLDIQLNTVVRVDGGYDDMSSYTDTRCNAVIDDRGLLGSGGRRGSRHVTAYNFLYAGATYNFPGSSNVWFSSADRSGNVPLCISRRRWTGPDTFCVPYALPTTSSPHATLPSSCDPDLGAPFGLSAMRFLTGS